MSDQQDPRDVLARSPMSRTQILALILLVGMSALDGYDILAITFAAPGIAAE